jgi:hypothetical protein
LSSTTTQKRSDSSWIGSKRPLNLIFQFSNNGNIGEGGSIFETDWIEKFIFGSHLGRPVRILEKNCLVNDSVYVFLSHSGDLFQRLKSGGFVNFGSFEMADEPGTQDQSYLELPSYSFRNYWFEKYRNSKAQFVPLGVKSGINFHDDDILIPTSKRRYLCNFVGTIIGRKERTYMFSVFNETFKKQCYISNDGTWPNVKGLNVMKYRDVLHNSRFTLSPFGGNPESLRFYEALESGSIPITTYSKDENDFIYGGLTHASGTLCRNTTPNNNYDFRFRDVPIPRLKDWNELNNLLEYYENNPEELDKLQESINSWWNTVKSNIQKKIKKIIDESFEKEYGAWS